MISVHVVVCVPSSFPGSVGVGSCMAVAHMAVWVLVCVGDVGGLVLVAAAGGVSARVMRCGAGWRPHPRHTASMWSVFCLCRQAACMGLLQHDV